MFPAHPHQLLRFLRPDWARQRVIYLPLLLTLAMGLAFGLASPVAMEPEQAERCRSYIGDFLELLPGARIDRLAEFRAALAQNGLLLLLILLFGLHLVGAPLIAALLFYKAFTIGFATAFLLAYQTQGGALILLLSLLPQNLILLPLLLRVAGEAAALSLTLWQQHSQLVSERRRVLGQYALFSLLAVALLLVSSLIRGYLSPLLLEFFFLLR